MIRGEDMTDAAAFAPWPPYPEPRHVAEMRAALTAVRALCVTATTGLASLASDSISARAVLALLPEETP